MLISEAIKRFIRRSVVNGLSQRTVEEYDRITHNLQVYAEQQDIKRIEDVSADVLQDYFIFLRNKRLSPYTLRGNYVTLNVFFNFLEQQTILPDNPLKRALKKPPLPKEKARTFKPSEVLQILNYYDKDSFVGMRNYAIMATFFGTGIRRSELLNLLVYDVDMDARLMVVTGKGNKTREIPVTPKLLRILKQYLSVRQKLLSAKHTDCNYLFISQHGHRLSQDGLRTVYKKLQKDLHIEGRRFSSHTWRHSFAKNFLINGGDLFTLQKILGHSDIATTQVYVDWTESEIRPQADRFSPLENRNWSRL